MRKFLDTFPNVSIESLYKVYPEYNVLINNLINLEKTINKGVSKEVEGQYYMLLDTLDAFLFRVENLERFNNSFNLPTQKLDLSLLPDRAKELTVEERAVIEEGLEAEIKELMKDAEEGILEELTQSTSVIEPVVLGEERKMLTREDFDIEEQYVGITFEYDSFAEQNFRKSLAMMQHGCKFYYTTFGSKSYVMWKLKGMARIIVETSEERNRYDDIFITTGTAKVYILNQEQKSLQLIFEIFKDAFEMDDESYKVLTDEFLFNTPIIRGAYQEGIVWTEATIFQQERGIIDRGDAIKRYFSSYLPLETICVLTYCDETFDKMMKDNREDKYKETVEKTIKEMTLYIEGIGDVPHSQDVLQKLQDKELLDIDYKVSPIGQGVLFYNKFNDGLIPMFRPFAYYMNNLEEQIKKSSKVYYSNFNGHTLYHTKKDVLDITYALAIPNDQRKNWGVDTAIQEDSFPQKWQQNQRFIDYQQYLPLSTDGSLSIRKSGAETQKFRKALQGRITFRDLERKNLYISGVERGHTYAIDAQNYKYIEKMYSDRNIRILGTNDSPYGASEERQYEFFMIVDDNNDLLAVIQAISKKTKASSDVIGMSNLAKAFNLGNQGEELQSTAGSVQPELFTTQFETLQGKNFPRVVWDVEELMEEIETLAPKFVTEGQMIGNTTPQIIQTDEDKTPDEIVEKEVIIDLDNPTAPLVDVENEKLLEIKNLNEVLAELQEVANSLLPEVDDDLEKEIKETQEKIEALK